MNDFEKWVDAISYNLASNYRDSINAYTLEVLNGVDSNDGIHYTIEEVLMKPRPTLHEALRPKPHACPFLANSEGYMARCGHKEVFWYEKGLDEGWMCLKHINLKKLNSYVLDAWPKEALGKEKIKEARIDEKKLAAWASRMNDPPKLAGNPVAERWPGVGIRPLVDPYTNQYMNNPTPVTATEIGSSPNDTTKAIQLWLDRKKAFEDYITSQAKPSKLDDLYGSGTWNPSKFYGTTIKIPKLTDADFAGPLAGAARCTCESSGSMSCWVHIRSNPMAHLTHICNANCADDIPCETHNHDKKGLCIPT